MTVVGVLAACATSAPTRYYTLNPIPPTVTAASRTGDSVWIARVIVPKTLDRTQLVRRVSANRLDVSENNRWAAPLDDMVRRVLSQDLATRLPENMVIQPDEPLSLGRLRRITVDLGTFESDLDGHIVLNVQWTVESSDNAEMQLRRDEHISVDGGSGIPDAVSAGMSRALAILADRMAAALDSAPAHASRAK
jgi:uncharacterized lipoprotein YmbA